MKQKDLALIMIVAFVSAVLAFLLSHWIFSLPQNHNQTAEHVDEISKDFPLPPSRYFNSNSINPTQPIQIGDSANPNPFNSQAH